MNTFHILGAALRDKSPVLLHVQAVNSKSALVIASMSASSLVVLFATREKVCG